MPAVTDLDRPNAAIDFERLPPQDLDAEMSVLGGMLMSKDAIAEVVEVLRPEDFYRPAHETLYGVVTDLYGAGQPVDAITVCAELTKRGQLERIGGVVYLHDLIAGVPTAANAGYYAAIVRDRAVLRRLVRAGTKVAELGYATDGRNVDDIVNEAQAEVYAVSDRERSQDYQPMGGILSEYLEELDLAVSRGGAMMGVPTGFSGLDQLTGGLHPGQMVIVAARPAMGKSTLGLDFARSASIKSSVTSVVFSLEMSKQEITQRLVAAESGVRLQKIRQGNLTDEDWDRIVSRMSSIQQAPMFIDDSPNMSLMEIRAKCRRLKQRHDLGLIVLDYMQLMSSGRRVESRQQEVSEFSRSLKLLAKELDVPVVAISQLNRGPEGRQDKKPMMSDLRESGSLEQDADVVILLHRPDQPGDRQPGEAHDANLIVAKHRNGPTANIDVLFLGHLAKFVEPARDL
ncbi:MAG: replicative DNA helicase [Bifidobacteriaceae bacterium]|nr:replicative DNA helicase [Bifidobacteriaceae bacterium]